MSNSKINYAVYYDNEINDLVYYRNNIEFYNIENYIKGKSPSKLTWLRSHDVEKHVENYLKYIETVELKMDTLYNKIVMTDNYSMDERNELYASLTQFNKLKKIKSNIIYYENNKLKQFLNEHIIYLKKIISKYKSRIVQTIYSDNYFISKLKTLYTTILDDCNKYLNNSDLRLTAPGYITKKTVMSNKQFKVGTISVDLIKSEFNNGMGHKLVHFSDRLREDKYNIFNTYNPNTGHAGILIKFYYNEKYLDKKPGLCHCDDFCINKKRSERPDKCTCLTIIIFRPANITITGGKTVKQIKYAYEFINKFIADNVDDVCYNISKVEIAENKMKKIIKKQPMFIKKSSIVY